MKDKHVRKLKNGLYRVYWKDGGVSMASVGATPDGGRWLAPCNWTHPTSDQIEWVNVKRMEYFQPHESNGWEPTENEVSEVYDRKGNSMQLWKRVKSSENPPLEDQLRAAEVDWTVLKRDQDSYQQRINVLNETKDKIYAQKSEVDRNLGVTKKTIKCLKREIAAEEDRYIYNPTVLLIDPDCGNFLPCEFQKYDDNRWLKGNIRGYSPEVVAPYKVLSKPMSRWAKNVRVLKTDWADYVQRIAPSMFRVIGESVSKENYSSRR